MKKISVFVSLFLCFCITFTAYGSELTLPEGNTEEPEMRWLCDADGNGSVSADDARFILRTSVGLEKADGIDLFYLDSDSDGTIDAADARIALRTAVDLEEKSGFAFEILDIKEASCSEEGHIKAECTVTGREASITIEKTPHSPPENICCTGKGICSVCGETVTAAITHSWSYAYWESMKECYYCGVRESFVHTHKFNERQYCKCGSHVSNFFKKELVDYVVANGKKTGYYYTIEEYREPLTFAVLHYDDSEKLTHGEGYTFTRGYCGYAIDLNGTIVYCDIKLDFVGHVVYLDMYTDTDKLVHIRGNVVSEKVNPEAEGDGIIIDAYDAVTDIEAYEIYFCQMMEGAVNDIVLWLYELAEEIDFTYIEHLFLEFKNVR